MKRFSGNAQITEFMGQTLSTPIPYSWEGEHFENLTEAKGSDSWPSDNEVLKIINTKLTTAAKANAYQAALKPVREAYEQTREYKVAQFIKSATEAKLFGGDVEKIKALAETQIPK